MHLVLCTAAADPLTEGLVAHWPLNKDSTSIKDVSGNNFHGKSEALKERDGRGGRVVYFDGVKSFITVPSKPELRPEGSFGMSFWIRLDPAEDTRAPIYSVFTSMGVSVFHSSLRVTFRNESYPNTGYADLMGGPKLNDEQWHHVVVSYDTKKATLETYVDGKEGESNKLPHPPIPMEEEPAITIGRNGRAFFKGEMSDFRIYNRPLSAREAKALFKVPPVE